LWPQPLRLRLLQRRPRQRPRPHPLKSLEAWWPSAQPARLALSTNR